MPPFRVALRLGGFVQTWNAYGNRYWPAQYIVDRNGKIVFQHDGEGQYEQIDPTIARLLDANS
jgi:hypothetical protein